MDANSLNGTMSNTTDVVKDTSVLGVVYLVVSVFTIVNNFTVVIVIAKSNNLHLPAFWNIMTMALFDCLFGFDILIFQVPSAFLNRFMSPGMEGVAYSIFTVLFLQRIMNVALVTCDRFISIHWPLKYMRLVTPKRYIIAFVISLVVNLCRLLSATLSGGEYVYLTNTALCIEIMQNGTLVMSMMVLCLVTVTVIFCTVKVVVTTVNTRRNVRLPSAACFITRSNLKLSAAVLGSVGVFFVCFLPLIGCSVWMWYTDTAMDGDVFTWAYVINISNSVFNVVFYSVSYNHFRMAVFRVFCKKHHRKIRQKEMIEISRTAI